MRADYLDGYRAFFAGIAIELFNNEAAIQGWRDAEREFIEKE